MGIGHLELEFLLNEHRYKPISGDVLAIGRQTTGFTEESARATLKRFSIEPRPSAVIEYDTTTQHGDGSRTLTDRSLFSLFSDCRFYAADISPYEGADFVFNICGRVPWRLRRRFDFVLDGGSLDNVFDPFAMLRNMGSMLRAGGRVFLTPWINSHPTAYVKLSPDWVADYFAVNEWADAQIYTLSNRLDGRPASMWKYETFGGAEKGYGISAITAVNQAQLLAIAEIGRRSTVNRPAVQQHYRGNDVQPYLASSARFAASRRPVFRFPIFPANDAVPPISDTPAMKHVATST